MSDPVFIPAGYRVPAITPHPAYIQSLERRKEIITRLCDSLHEFLSFDIDAAIEQSNQKPPRMPKPTIEDLNEAQEQYDLTHAQLEALRKMCDDMPEKLGDLLRLTQMPAVERMMVQLQERISWIQKAMEEPEPDQSNPWDGSHRIGTLCAVCAHCFEGFETSIPALKITLKAAGWGRDADGDHICPSCLAASTAPATEPASAEASSQPKGE